MMNKFVVAVAQIAVGLVVGSKASDAITKFVEEPIKKIIKAKKGEV